ncbi:MAG: methyltransferase domain-containing protein [Burkholderiales bacterium]|nr:methyltransferase domain-containing protein [Burkholderiales bacterium]
MNQNFYRAFEDRFRGSRDLIKNRLSAYRPLLNAIASAYPAGNAVDLGCGRGEWLEHMQDAGLRAVGVDLDDGMLADCTTRNLPAVRGDAIVYLRTLPAESQILVSAFHFVEHITFAEVQTVITESLRVLRPGGLLILETPNSENLTVGASSFYRDPTHQRPIHSSLLVFAVEHAGFARAKLLRLNEDGALRAKPRLDILDVLNGTSPDYAVVAQKAAEPAFMANFDAAFGRDVGLSLAQVARRYDDELHRRFETLQHELTRTVHAMQRMDAVHQQQAELLATHASQLAQLRKALSPLLWLRAQSRRLGTAMRSLIGLGLRSGIRAGKAAARRVPFLKAAAASVLKRFPSLARQVERFSNAPGTAPAAHTLPPITDFEQLRSVRLMRALAELPEQASAAAPVSYLQVSDDAR